MHKWTFYPVFIATIVSVVGLSRLAIQEHASEDPLTLSALAAAEQSLLKHFRNILLFCGVLFGVTVFGFIVPRSSEVLLVTIFGALMIGGELLAGCIPARNNTLVIHNVLAQIMGAGMLGLAFTFWVSLEKPFSFIEAFFSLGMSLFGAMTLLDKKRYIKYELAFIFTSHFSIVVAAIALR